MTEKSDKKEEIKKVQTESDAPTEKEADSSASDLKKKKKKIRHQILKGQAHIKCTYNNTIVTISDLNGAVLGWSSSGLLKFKGAKKATPYAATQVVGDVAEKVRKYGMSELEVYVKGVGNGREASIRALANRGFDIQMIKDVTPIPHNGCRPKKPRRV